MTLFIAGLIIFFAAHGLTSFARGARQRLETRLGPGPYKGLYSLVSLGGFALILMGWPEADRRILYETPYALRYGVYGLMFIALVMMAAYALPKGRIARAVRHPMLAGVKIWAFAHLLVNGDVRSVLLFGSFLAYSVAARLAANQRAAPPDDGHQSAPILFDGLAVAIGAGAFVVVFAYAHPLIAGVSLY